MSLLAITFDQEVLEARKEYRKEKEERFKDGNSCRVKIDEIEKGFQALTQEQILNCMITAGMSDMLDFKSDS